MEITCVNLTAHPELTTYLSYFENVAKLTSAKLKLSQTLECAVILVDDLKMQEINLKYRQIDAPTDVISFALLEADYFHNEADSLGDIFINYDALVRQAKLYQHSLQREATFLFLHGLLHLLGYDHQTLKQEQIMFQLN